MTTPPASKLRRLAGDDVDDEDFTWDAPDPVPENNGIQPWPEVAKRQIADLQQRVRHLEVMVHAIVNGEQS